MDSFLIENLSHDPIHGYIGFVATTAGESPWTPNHGGPLIAPGHPAEICERQIIDHPWVQRMRQIRQLQTAWWVFPSAEHSRFQHILGAMHLAGRAIEQFEPSLRAVDPNTPPKPVLEGLLRMAGLLHDVGHGPFGHFFDAHYLSDYGLTHEKLGSQIIQHELGDMLRGLRRSPAGSFPADMNLAPAQIAWLIERPAPNELPGDHPRWLQLLRCLFCGIYTVDNMDFVLRDAFMTGLNPRAFDLQRILHYSWYTPSGLTIHERGIPALVHFLSMKAELFRSVYFHRTVRAIDLELADLFRDSRRFLFPGDPRDHLSAYLQLTEFSLLTDVARWRQSKAPGLQALGDRWHAWLNRRVPWTMVCQRNLSFGEDQSEGSSVFSSPRIFAECIREHLPSELKSLPFRVDLARNIHRPHTAGATGGLNFYFDTSNNRIRPLTTHDLYRKLPISHTIARIYARNREHEKLFAASLDKIAGGASEDDLTNM